MEINDIIGNRVGKLVVQRFIRQKEYKWYVGYLYECVCDCGNLIEVERRNLLQSHTKSCGCLKKIAGAANKGWKGCGQITGRQWSQIRSHAKNRDIPVDISIQDAWEQFEKQKGLCALTKLPIQMPKNSKKDISHTASLDRINSEKGYVLGNIQWVHKDLNYMKNDFTHDEFVRYCRLVVENHER